jgi:hypothetical protein
LRAYTRGAQVFLGSDKVEQINDTYWTLRAEVVPPAEATLAAGEFLLHVYHMLPLTDSGAQVRPSGLFRVFVPIRVFMSFSL